MKLYIKERREQCGMTLAQLGNAVDREPHTIFYYENGTINISVLMLAKIAAALDCTIDDLLSPPLATTTTEGA